MRTQKTVENSILSAAGTSAKNAFIAFSLSRLYIAVVSHAMLRRVQIFNISRSFSLSGQSK